MELYLEMQLIGKWKWANPLLCLLLPSSRSVLPIPKLQAVDCCALSADATAAAA